MLARVVPFLRAVVATRPPCKYTPRLPCNYAQLYHKEISNVQIVGQKRAYFLAVRQPEKGGEKFLKLTERSGGRHTYVSINLSDLGQFLNSIETASKGNNVNRFLMNRESFEVQKVESLDSYNFAIKIVKRKRDGKFNMLFIDELQLNRVLRVMRDVLDKHGPDVSPQ